MAETAGLAFGVISFSIQACERLIWYIDGVKHCKNKAGSLLDEVSGLANELGNLQSIISQLDPTQQLQSVKDASKQCMDAIAVLQNELHIPTSNRLGPFNLRVGLQKATQRLLYPFKESNLLGLREAISNTLQSLNLALHTLSIDQHRLGLERVIRNNQLEHHNLAHSIKQVHMTTQNQLLGQGALIQSNVVAVEQQVSSLHSDLQSLRIALRPHLSNPLQLDVMLRMLARMVEIEAKLDTLAGTYVPNRWPPSGSQGSHTLDSSRVLPKPCEGGHSPRRQSNKCNCSNKVEMVTFSQRPLVIWKTRKLPHVKSCAKYKSVLPDTRTTVEVSWGSQALGAGVRITLTLLRKVGYSSILPSMTIYNVVKVTSPAFRVIDEIQSKAISGSEIDWTAAWQSLKELYDTRAASPHDQLMNGMTVIHYLCEFMTYLEHSEPFWRMICPYFDNELRERDNSGYTCVDYLLNYSKTLNSPGVTTLAVQLCDYGSCMSANLYAFTISEFSNLWARNDYENYPDAIMDSNEGMDMILLKSETGLKSYIDRERCGEFLKSTDALTLYRLSTATGWEQGCRIMFERNLRISPKNSAEARRLYETDLFDEAVESLEPGVINFWIRARRSVCKEDTEFIGSLESTLHYTFGMGCLASHEILLKAIVTERTRLGALAREHGLFTQTADELLDARYICVLNALREKGVDLQDISNPPVRSIYHWDTDAPYPNLSALNMLYDSGFRDVTWTDSRCCLKHTTVSPMLYMITQNHASGLDSLLDIVDWFCSKGASLDEFWPGSDVTALHCLGHTSGHAIRHWLDDRSLNLFRIESYLSNKTSDTCTCNCSTLGCGFVHNFWKGLQTTRISRDAILEESLTRVNLLQSKLGQKSKSDMSRNRSPKGLIAAMISFVERAAIQAGDRWVVTELIRLLVFTGLGLRHTCCDISLIVHDGEPNFTDFSGPRYSRAKTRRIRQEDAELASILEDLVTEMQARYDVFNGDLLTFVNVHMDSMIKDSLQRLKVSDEREFSLKRLQFGVNMDKHAHNS